MTALTKNMSRPHKSPPGGTHFRALPLIGYTNKAGGNVAHEVYKGSFVFYDADDTEGYRRIVAASTTAADTVGGIAIERQSITSEITGDAQRYVTVAIDGVWAFPIGAITIADVGKDIYLSDDNVAVTAEAGNANLWIGKLASVDTEFAWVDIEPACGKLNNPPT